MLTRTTGSAIRLADDDAAIAACYDTMVHLRPHLSRQHFVARIRRQMAEGYRLAALRDDDAVVAVAGFRLVTMLYSGRQLYVDDLVTQPARRAEGHGARLMAWLREHAHRQGCAELHLDSALQREAAHRFYQRQGLIVVGYHFTVAV
ncbi:MAG TPA: GNAT family N-acetyltransferase [Dokdonella sp.]|uniref:GNAT family N-acetyltransferase n=1 Tax=Dokdonella sp. TaxID=2291710 RepID=UPI002CAFEE72|nr:GNAT family N-acetyltransferase [Dokdonella sp.]HUD40853.1 GNAT family N-acetyltransferase [Dokdonella sp.]